MERTSYDFASNRVKEVVIDGTAVLKIVKHCNDNVPTMATGTLLGLDVGGVLEVTYIFPLKEIEGNADESGDISQANFQKMLEMVGVDNYQVGWYTSMYFGTAFTLDVVDHQQLFQSHEDTTDNCVVIIFDPIQSTRGNLVLRAFRLSDQFVEMRRSKRNEFIKPAEIFVELPVRIRNSGHVSAFLRCLEDSHSAELDCDFEPLSLTGTDSYTERSVGLLSDTVGEFVQAQQNFQVFSKLSSKSRLEHVKWINQRAQANVERRLDGDKELPLSYEDAYALPNPQVKAYPEAPPRVDSLLLLRQLDAFCEQIDDHVESSTHKLGLASELNASP